MAGYFAPILYRHTSPDRLLLVQLDNDKWCEAYKDKCRYDDIRCDGNVFRDL